LTDDGRVTGARTGSLTIKNASARDRGPYDAVVSNRAGQVVATAVRVRVR